jgi:hypothetical protein
MGLRKEILALAFGALLILVTFGDNHLGKVAGVSIGNLDTILGYRLWPVLDIVYPLALITIFLLYGWSIGAKVKLKSASTFLFASFLIVLALVNIDDVFLGLSHAGLTFAIYPSQEYWTTISWIFPAYSAIAFFSFGKTLKINRNVAK